METRLLQSTYDRGVIQDLPRHMLPPGSVWSMFDLIPDIDGAPVQKRGGWKAGDPLAGATSMKAVAYSPFGGIDTFCALDDRAHLWKGPSQPYEQAVLSFSPSLYWRLGDEVGSSFTNDDSGHNRFGDATSVTFGQTGALSGDPDKAALFGASSKIESHNYTPFNSGSKRTFMGWFKRTSIANRDALFSASHAPSIVYVGGVPFPLDVDDNLGAELVCNAGGSDVAFVAKRGTAAVTWAAAWPGTGVYVHWALTYDDSTKTAELFINGVSKGTRVLAAGYSTPTGQFLSYHFTIGDNGDDSHSVGTFDEVAVFESILAGATITAIAGASSVWVDEGLAALTKQRPIFFNNTLIILPDGGTYTTPKKFDGTTISSLGLTGLTGVTPLWGVAYKSRLVIADTDTVYFSNILDPETYDVDSFVKATNRITGLAALPNMIAIFSSGAVERLRGTTPPSTTSDGDMTLEPAFKEGCLDARSIVVYQDQMIWANKNGVHISDGAGISNLVEVGGIRDYWHDLMSSYNSTWTLAAGIFKGRYVLAITDGAGAFVAAFVCNLARKTWSFMNNLPAAMFTESQGATSELVMALSNHNYLGYCASAFDPTAGDSDGDGTPVQPSIELAFFRNGTGSSRWRELFLGVDLENAGAQTGQLQFFYTTTPDSTSYTQLVDDAGNPITVGGTNGFERHRLPLHLAANGIGLKIVQVGATAQMSLFDLEAVTRIREGRY